MISCWKSRETYLKDVMVFGLGRTGVVIKYGRHSLWMNVALRQLFDC